MTPESAAWFVLAFCATGAAVTAMVIFGRWAMSRVEVPAEVERFTDAIVPENADVLAQEAAAYSEARDAMADEMVALLEAAIADVDALVEAAALVDELDELEALLADMSVHVGRVDKAAAA